MVSAVPALQPHTLTLCILILSTLTIVNLRGVRESGLAFIIPVIVFVVCVGVAMVIGLIQAWQSGGNPVPVVPPPTVPEGTAAVSAWLLLGAFANGCTAMTGVEAVSNGAPLFRKPKVPNAQWTLTAIVGILALFLLGLAYLCPVYHIGSMDQEQPGYQTMYSQLVSAVAGYGAFYYISIASIFIVLACSAQTSFAGFPRVCRFLAEDGHLPSAFAERGRRLVYSVGLIVLAILSALILIAFGGITSHLIPLFAVGAFTAFVLSQVGMVAHWLGRRGRGFRTKLALNALGAVMTGIALTVIIVAKFTEGAWMIVVVAPPLVLLLYQINRHYREVALEVDRPLELQTTKLQPPVVIIPIDGWDRVAENAVRFGLRLSDDVTALNVRSDKDEMERLMEMWDKKVEKPAKAAGSAVPHLAVIYSPYRQIYQPILDFVSNIKKEKSDRIIAVIIPELVEPHWYEYLLHNVRAAGLRAFLFLERDKRTIVITTPWYLRE